MTNNDRATREEIMLQAMGQGIRVTIPLVAAQVLEASPRRIALVFPTPLTNPYTMSLRPGPALGQGLTLQTSSGLYVLTIWDVGQSIGNPWYGISGTAPQGIEIIEVLRGPD